MFLWNFIHLVGIRITNLDLDKLCRLVLRNVACMRPPNRSAWFRDWPFSLAWIYLSLPWKFGRSEPTNGDPVTFPGQISCGNGTVRGHSKMRSTPKCNCFTIFLVRECVKLHVCVVREKHRFSIWIHENRSFSALIYASVKGSICVRYAHWKTKH